MAKTKSTPKPTKTAKVRAVAKQPQELDGTYFLKLMLYLLVGATWIKISHGGSPLPIPAGLLIGLMFASHEHFQIDRKIEFALLLVAMFVGYFAPYGLYVSY